jgi:hypothetical protein
MSSTDSAFNPWPVAVIIFVVIVVWFNFEYRPKRQAKAAAVTARAASALQPTPQAPPMAQQQRPNEQARPERQANALPRVAPPVQPQPRQTYQPEPVSPTQTIYLCKSYAGGTFWSNAVCSSQRATIDRMTTVPSHLPFEQQVAIARGEANAAAALYAPPPVAQSYVAPQAQNLRSSECAMLEAEVQRLDAMARQPQSGQMQDWIKARRMEARSRQAALRC